MSQPHVVTPPGSPRPARPDLARMWAALALVLALAGVALIASSAQAQHSPAPVRLVDPVADVATPAEQDELAATSSQLTETSGRLTETSDRLTGTSAQLPRASGGAGSPSVRLDPIRAAAAGQWPDVAPLPASAPVRVTIPVLGVTSSIMDLGLNADGSMQLPPGAYPVGWYDHSPTPGQLGPAVLVGHVDWAGKDGAFYGLRVLRPGDRIIVDRADGTRATFRVGRVEKHAKTAFPTGEVYGDVGWSALRLITCGGYFDEDSGNYEDNVVVFARLVSTSSTQ